MYVSNVIADKRGDDKCLCCRTISGEGGSREWDNCDGERAIAFEETDTESEARSRNVANIHTAGALQTTEDIKQPGGGRRVAKW